MDEKLQNILDNVHKSAQDAANTATEAAQNVGKRATQLFSTGKLNIQLMDLKTQVSEQLRQVGEMVYATHTGSPTDSNTLLQKLQDIDVLNAQISTLDAQLQRAWNGGTVVCPHCGTSAKKGDQFCRNCGAKL